MHKWHVSSALPRITQQQLTTIEHLLTILCALGTLLQTYCQPRWAREYAAEHGSEPLLEEFLEPEQ